MTDAWSQTSTGGCTTPQKTGADPYRLHWDFDTAGDRTSEISYDANGSTAYSSAYTYGGTGFTSHELAAVVTTGTRGD
jgi:hypothetical protein